MRTVVAQPFCIVSCRNAYVRVCALQAMRAARMTHQDFPQVSKRTRHSMWEVSPLGYPKEGHRLVNKSFSNYCRQTLLPS